MFLGARGGGVGFFVETVKRGWCFREEREARVVFSGILLTGFLARVLVSRHFVFFRFGI